ncbi:MAG TPA: circularly permuted type 2 ATP-grasp protein, partial [Methylocystis sp.]|nr:circularly permuted type 2 ATP-grasp protein [Methylocystis sp.]
MSTVQFDEMNGTRGASRAPYEKLAQWLSHTPPSLLASRRDQAELMFRRIGITFAVYGAQEAAERLIPFDILPRILSRGEWTTLEKGLIQRVKALNLFLADLYGAGEAIKAGVVPAELVYRNPGFCPEMFHRRAPHDIFVHIAGVDIVRTSDDGFYVLEDNLRTPSGVSYMLENREVMMRLFPELFATHKVAPVDDYPDKLLATLRSDAPPNCGGDPTVVVLTPGQYNSAFYEHSFLADKLGVELVEGRDLFVRDNIVYMRATEGPRRVDVIYRRIDDDFLDPLTFRPDSALGVAGLMGAYHAGNVTLANAVGGGVADDKAMYTYVPDIVR